ncbi:phosphorylase family protein [Halosimplex sp. J119]
MTVDLDVLVLPAFDDSDRPHGEVAPWEDAYDITHEVAIDGTPAPLWYTDSGIGVITTGIGKAPAAATTTALLTSNRVDLTDALVLSVACAGAPPQIPIGSVVITESVVDWDSKYRFDSDAEDRPIAINPYTSDHSVYELDDGLIEEIRALAESVDLATGSDCVLGDGGQAVSSEPEVLMGANLCGDELWHGPELAGQAEWLVDQYGCSPYRVTAMEDVGTAMVLDRFDRLDQYCSIRGVSNHDRLESETTDGATGLVADARLRLSVENAAAVARPVVDDRLA